MPSQWTSEANFQLLLTIINLVSPTPPKWDEVAKRMGPDYTAEAVRQHFQKLRKNAKTEPANNEGETPATPSKRKRTSPVKKNAKVAEADLKGVDEDDDSEIKENKSPKKVKVEEETDDLV